MHKLKFSCKMKHICWIHSTIKWYIEIITILHLKCHILIVFSQICKNITFVMIWFIVDLTHILTVRHDLTFA